MHPGLQNNEAYNKMIIHLHDRPKKHFGSLHARAADQTSDDRQDESFTQLEKGFSVET
jgi:hypothetical protein